MSGLEAALAGATANAISSELLQWLQNRGPDLSENDWAEAGVPVSRELRAEYKQFTTGYQSRRQDRMRQCVEDAGRIYRELSYIGEDEEFDPDTISLYADLADLCVNWADSPELNIPDGEGYSDEFFDLHNRYKTHIE